MTLSPLNGLALVTPDTTGGWLYLVNKHGAQAVAQACLRASVRPATFNEVRFLLPDQRSASGAFRAIEARPRRKAPAARPSRPTRAKRKRRTRSTYRIPQRHWLAILEAMALLGWRRGC
jgi:hypothetical protein